MDFSVQDDTVLMQTVCLQVGVSVYILLFALQDFICGCR